MNKRFSTLLAAALVAGGMSFNAAADAYTAEDVKDVFIHLGDGANTVLSMTDDGTFSTVSTSAGWKGQVDQLLGTLWQVKATAQTTTGAYTFTFTNRLSGQLLSVKLQSDQKGGGRKALITENEKGGNTVWGWDQTVGLYAVQGDSTFYIGFDTTNDGLTFKAVKGAFNDSETINGTAIKNVAVDATGVPLTADDFNALVEKEKGRLFFTDENVSSNEKNVLTDNKWFAIDSVINTSTGAYAASADNSTTFKVLYLTNGKEHKRTLADQSNAEVTQKEYLLVNYNFYDSENIFNELIVDTIAVDPGMTAVTANSARLTAAKHHPATAAFQVEYYIPNDSMVIKPMFRQTSIDVDKSLYQLYSDAYAKGTEDDVETLLANVVKDFSRLGIAVNETFRGHDGTDPYTAKNDLFTTTDIFNWNGSQGGNVSGQELIDKVQSSIDEYEYSKTTTVKAKEEVAIKAMQAYIDALDGLTIVEPAASTSVLAVVTTTTYKNDANYWDGMNAMTVSDKAVDGSTSLKDNYQVVLRKLSNTKVLTIGEVTGHVADDDVETNGNLIATIKTSDKDATVGGDATIAEGIYYVIDAKKGEDAVNENYGKYYDLNPVNPTDYVASAQAFNPYAQFVVTKAAGVEKGNYTIENRGGIATTDWAGVTNVVDAENGVYAIAGDTIQLVAAEDVDAKDAYIGFKYIAANDAANNKFTITSAAAMITGESIVMTEDSTLAVAGSDEEILYTLVPSANKDEEYGLEGKKLKRMSYTIMNADSAYIIEDNGNYVFSNGKYGTANGDPVEFYMIAVDTDSTYVLTDGLTSSDQKMVVSTQYKTISAEPLTARNDMFLIKPQSAPATYMSLPKHVRLNGADGNTIALNSQNQGVAVREGDELKAAYEAEDFTFWLDTADYKGANPFTYYITKGVAADEEAGVEASRLYMYNATDSAETAKIDKEYYNYGNSTRVIFREAVRYGADSLVVAGDTLTLDGKALASSPIAEPKEGVKDFRFYFPYVSEAGNECYIVSEADGKYVHNINGVLVMGDKEDALIVTIEEAQAPTANDEITASEVKVIAGNGQITINGAAGKKVVVSNILGQVVANTVLTSDNATIAAPQGVVVVAVEGEEAVKAIVK